MECARCSGLMVEDAPLTDEGAFRLPTERSWRCVNCGELLDEQIFVNRYPRLRVIRMQRKALGPSSPYGRGRRSAGHQEER
jgi:hypothetical protein